MKAITKIAAAAVAAVCAVSLAACGGSGSGKATNVTYPQIKLGTTGKDIKTTIKLFSHRTDLAQDSYNGTTCLLYTSPSPRD